MSFSFNYYNIFQFVNNLHSYLISNFQTKYVLDETLINDWYFMTSYDMLLNELKMLGWDASYLDLVMIFQNLC